MSQELHLSRRQVIGLLGVSALALTRGEPGESAPVRLGAAPAGPPPLGLLGLDCVVTPAQTEGPYFVDERLERSDLRLDPTTREVSAGIPLALAIGVSRVDGTACAPLPGAMVDVWQCDALGVYSDVLDAGGFFDTRGRKFLRGHQLTDRTGKAEFQSVYPGWYAGRTVHIHFKVRVFEGDRRAHEFTSQLYFDDRLTDQVFQHPPYNTRGARSTRNEQDRIYQARNSGAALHLQVTPEGAGYRGSVSVGLRMA